jgi:hypothetical protein
MDKVNRYWVMVRYGAQSALVDVMAHTEDQAIHKAMGLAPYAVDAYVYHIGDTLLGTEVA